MNPRDLSQAKNPDLRNSLDAMRRAAKQAREKAIQTNTAIVLVRNGKPIHITADTLRKQAANASD